MECKGTKFIESFFVKAAIMNWDSHYASICYRFRFMSCKNIMMSNLYEYSSPTLTSDSIDKILIYRSKLYFNSIAIL